MAIHLAGFVYGFLALFVVASNAMLLDSRAGRYGPQFTSASDFVEWMVRRANGDRTPLIPAPDAEQNDHGENDHVNGNDPMDGENWSLKRSNAMNVLEDPAAPGEHALDKQMTKEVILEDLWGGQDFDENFMNLAELQSHSPAKHSEEQVQVLGLERAGVDLLNALLYMNFGDRLTYHSEPQDAANHGPGVWKHANIQLENNEEPDFMKSIWQAKVRAIMVVRNPLSWLRTLKVSPPKEFFYCITKDDWLSEECEHPYPCGTSSRVKNYTYKNLQKIWNTWTDAYTNAAANGVPSHMVTTYEDIVRDPQGMVQRICTFLKIEPPAHIVVPDELEDHGQTAALHRIRTRSYLEGFSTEELEQACAGLNPDVAKLYGYSDCADIAHGNAHSEIST